MGYLIFIILLVVLFIWKVSSSGAPTPAPTSADVVYDEQTKLLIAKIGASPDVSVIEEEIPVVKDYTAEQTNPVAVQ